MSNEKMRESFTLWWKSEIKDSDDGLVSPSLREAFEAGAAQSQRDAMAVAEAVLDACGEHWNRHGDCDDVDLAAIVEAVRPGKRETVNQQMLAALKELRDAYQEFMGLPACKANAAIAAAEATQSGALADEGAKQPASAQQQGEPVEVAGWIHPSNLCALQKRGEKNWYAMWNHDGDGRLVPLYTAPPAQACSVPDGFALVPVEPTREMFQAVNAADDKAFAGGSHHGECFETLWHVALDAAPKGGA